MKGPIWEWSIPFLLLYFAPVFIGGYRRAKDRHASWPVWGLFLIIFFTGWSVIGWLWALRMAFKDVALPSLSTQASGGGGGGNWTAPAGYQPPVEEQQRACPSCHNGTHHCSMCAGRGTWWEGSTLLHCQTCLSRGRIDCTNCRGTGKVG